MYFDNFNSLIQMGGHGLYVWTAYGIGLLVILYNVVAPIRKHRRVISAIHRHHLRNDNATHTTSQPETITEQENAEAGCNTMDRGEAV